MKNKRVLIGGGVAAAALSSALFLAQPSSVKLEGKYQIKDINPYRSEITITVPDEFTPDICELKFNDLSVTKTILPDGLFAVYPIITKNAARLSVDMYIRGELVGYGDFGENGTIEITTSGKYINKAVSDDEAK